MLRGLYFCSRRTRNAGPRRTNMAAESSHGGGQLVVIAERKYIRDKLDEIGAAYLTMTLAPPPRRNREHKASHFAYVSTKQALRANFVRYLIAREEGDSVRAQTEYDALERRWNDVIGPVYRTSTPEFSPLYAPPGVPHDARQRHTIARDRVQSLAQFRKKTLDQIENIADMAFYLTNKELDISVTTLLDTMESFFAKCNMRERATENETYPAHVSRLATRLRELLEHLFVVGTEKARAKQNQNVADSLPGTIATGVTDMMYRYMQDAVLLMMLHLVDAGLAPEQSMLQGRFGRTQQWAATTGVPHGQWYIPLAATVRPATQPRSRTPSPEPMDLSAPPPTVRNYVARHVTAPVESEESSGSAPARTPVQRFQKTRRALQFD